MRMTGKEKNINEELQSTLNNTKQLSENLQTNFHALIKHFSGMQDLLTIEKQRFDQMMVVAQKQDLLSSDIIKFNVGGTLFSTLKSTLDQKIKKHDEDGYYDPNYLQLLVSGLIKPSFDENKAIFIDRDPQYFRYIMCYLRIIKSGKEFKVPDLNTWDSNNLKIEAEFYQLRGLLNLLHHKDKFDNCQILTEVQAKVLFKLCEFSLGTTWKLIYRSSRDGFNSNTFHNRCDFIQNTLTIIKTTNNYIFGGFVSVAWDSTSGYKNDPNAFIFSLTNRENKPLKLKCKNGSNAIRCESKGPVFGNGDICISHIDSCYSQLGNSYYNVGSASSDSLLAGAFIFQVKEIEVFKKG